MRFKPNMKATVGEWEHAIRWCNKAWTRCALKFIATKSFSDVFYEFSVYSLYGDLLAEGLQPNESTLRQIINRLVQRKLIINIKD